MIDQIGITIFGLGALYCFGDTRPQVQKWGCLIGLMSEPFWIYSSWTAQQWGIVVLTGFYTAGYARGVYNQWFKKNAVH
jgi:hypothetical protein